jgi:hypothetical protein
MLVYVRNTRRKGVGLYEKDVLFVYVSVVFGLFVIEQLTPVVQETIHASSSPLAFTDNPPF